MVYKETLEQLEALLLHYKQELNSLRDRYDRAEKWPPEQTRLAQEITRVAGQVDALESLRYRLTHPILKRKEGKE